MARRPTPTEPGGSGQEQAPQARVCPPSDLLQERAAEPAPTDSFPPDVAAEVRRLLAAILVKDYRENSLGNSADATLTVSPPQARNRGPEAAE